MLCKASVLLVAVLISAIAQQTGPASVGVPAIDADLVQKLLNAKRIFVESFGDDPVNKSLAAMVLDSVRTTKRFIITENHERADLILKGIALEKTTEEYHALGSATSVAGASGHHSAQLSGSPRHVSGSSHGGFVSGAAGHR